MRKIMVKSINTFLIIQKKSLMNQPYQENSLQSDPYYNNQGFNSAGQNPYGN